MSEISQCWMHFWNLLSHDNSGGTVITYKAKKSFALYCCTKLKHDLWFSFVIEISLWLWQYKHIIWCREVNRSKQLVLRTSHPHPMWLESFTMDWVCSDSPHIKYSHCTFFLRLSKEPKSAADPQKLLEYMCSHLTQSFDLWKGSAFCVLKPSSDPNQPVVNGHNRETNFKTSILFPIKMLV